MLVECAPHWLVELFLFQAFLKVNEQYFFIWESGDFFLTKKRFFLQKTHTTSILVQTYKTHIFSQILLQISYFFSVYQLFSVKNVKNKDFDQLLECAAPKRCSKYTTTNIHNIYKSFLTQCIHIIMFPIFNIKGNCYLRFLRNKLLLLLPAFSCMGKKVP